MRKYLIFGITIFLISGLKSQNNEYIKILDNGVQVKNLTAIALKFNELKTKMDSISSNKGKSVYQEQFVELTHYMALDVRKKNEYTNEGKKSLAVQNGNLSWYYLFDGQYKKANVTAKKGLSFDNAQVWINANLGHSYLLLGKYKSAKKTYKQILNQQHRNGDSFKNVILSDLEVLESEGITNSHFNKIRKYIKRK